MPFKSEAQRRKFHQLVKEGKMSKATLDEWESATTGKLPKRKTRVGTKVRQPRRTAK